MRGSFSAKLIDIGGQRRVACDANGGGKRRNGVKGSAGDRIVGFKIGDYVIGR